MKKYIILVLVVLISIICIYGQDSGLLAVTRKNGKNIVLYPDGRWEPLQKVIQVDNEWKLIDQGSIKITEYEIDNEKFLVKTVYNNSTNKTFKKLFVKISLYDQNNNLINSNEKSYYGRATPGSTKRRNISVKYGGKAPVKITVYFFC
jgi:hypothetical protein